jgi:hypothetical protein
MRVLLRTTAPLPRRRGATPQASWCSSARSSAPPPPPPLTTPTATSGSQQFRQLSTNAGGRSPVGRSYTADAHWLPQARAPAAAGGIPRNVRCLPLVRRQFAPRRPPGTVPFSTLNAIPSGSAATWRLRPLRAAATNALRGRAAPLPCSSCPGGHQGPSSSTSVCLRIQYLTMARWPSLKGR